MSRNTAKASGAPWTKCCRWLGQERNRTLLLFLSPAIVLYAAFFLWPMAQALYVALFRWSGLSMNRHYVGLDNFRKLFTQDPLFVKALSHNLTFLVVSLVVLIPLALFFATALSRKTRGAQVYRAIYLFPNIISVVAIAVLWYFVYDPKLGLLNSLLKLANMKQIPWLGDPKTALPAVIATSIWYSLGFYIVLFLAGIQSVPDTYYEAAAIDGASGWTAFRHITIPLIWEVLKLAVVYLVIHTLNIFGLVWIMTEGGPDSHTETLLTYLYRRAFVESDFGYATALGVVVFVIVFTVTLLLNRLMRRETVEL